MASFKVRALYDFNGEPHSTELTIVVGDVLTVTRSDVGEGWYEGTNDRGLSGLFPVDYVERINNGTGSGVYGQVLPPSLPPPNAATPVAAAAPMSINSAWDSSGGAAGAGVDDDDCDPTWDDEDSYEAPNQGYVENVYANSDVTSTYAASHVGAHAGTPHGHGGDASGTGTVPRKSALISFSSFTKLGGDDYLQGVAKGGKPECSIVLDADSNTMWTRRLDQYTVSVQSPKKESKLKGLKTFIAYQLTPSISNANVSRRYKHFDWLHERLTEKFSVIAVPPLPDKQISGRYEDIFIERRRAQLQEFVDYVCRHPVLSASAVWMHFLQCTDEKAWKAGKRGAERDPLIGAHFCECLDAPERDLLPQMVEERVSNNLRFIQKLDGSVKALMGVGVEQCKKNQGHMKADMVKVGDMFFALGSAIESGDDKIAPSHLATATKRVGQAYLDVGKLYEEQARHDWEPLLDKLHLYRGLTGSFQEVFAFQKAAVQKKKDLEKTLPSNQLVQVQKRTDVVNYALLAELSHFRQERDSDFKQAMRCYLQQQVDFYKKIVARLETTLQELN